MNSNGQRVLFAIWCYLMLLGMISVVIALLVIERRINFHDLYVHVIPSRTAQP